MLTIKNAACKRLLLLLVPLLILAGCTPPGPRALLKGRRLIEQARFPEAIAQLKTATSILATNAQAWNYLGLAYQYAAQYTNAVQAYQRALSLDRDLAEVHFNLGCLWLEQNRLKPASAEFTVFTTLRPRSAEGWLKLADTQLCLARSRSGSSLAPGLSVADKSFREALRLSPENAEALNGVGLVQLEYRRPREAAQCFSRVLKREPSYGPALLNLAIVSQVYLNDRAVALEKYRQYLGLSAHQPQADAVRAAVLELEGELKPPPHRPGAPHSGASPAGLNSLRSQGSTPPGHVAGAAHGASTSSPERRHTGLSARPPRHAASRSVSSPIVSPTSAVATPHPRKETPDKGSKPGFFSRINPFRQHGEAGAGREPAPARRHETLSADETGTVQVPGSPRYHYRSPAKPAAGNTAAALRAFRAGFEAQQAGHLEEAIQHYRQATRLDPADYDAYYNLGLAAAASNRLDQSLLAYEYALAIRPESVDARYNFALVLKRAKYVQDAVNELNRLLARHPAEPRAHLVLGNLYAGELHQPAKAREQYLKVLQTDPHNPQAPAIREWLMSNSH